MRERGKGGGVKSLGACGHLRCFQHPRKPLDSFSSLSGEFEEGGDVCERRVKGSTLEVAFLTLSAMVVI